MDNRERIAQLAQRARKGHKDAFNELYLLTRDRAYFVAFSITKNEQDALDILQDSYLKAWQGIASLQKPEQFSAWLNQITGNTAKNYVKKRKPQLFQPGGEDEPDILSLQAEQGSEYIPHAAMDTEETRRLIMDIVDGLPEDQRLCVLMYYFDDLPLQEIAAALEIPYSTVMSRLALARKKISRGVEELERKGTKLYGAAPIPLLIWLLKHTAAGSVRLLPPLVLPGPAAGGTAGAATAAAALPKAVAGIAAVVVLTGGAFTAKKVIDSRRPPAIDSFVTTAAAAAETAAAVNAEPEPFTFPQLPSFGTGYAYTRPSLPERHAAAGPDATRAVPPATAAPAATAAAATTRATSTASRYVYINNNTGTAAPGTTTGGTTAATTTATTTAASTTTATTSTAASTSTTTTSTTTTTTTASTTTTTTTTTTTAAPQLITKTVGGVVFEYTDDILSPDADFRVNEGWGYTTEIIYRDTGVGVAPFNLECYLDGALIQPLSGDVTVKLPVPAAHLANIGQLEVKHSLSLGVAPHMNAWPEGGHLVFTTNII